MECGKLTIMAPLLSLAYSTAGSYTNIFTASIFTALAMPNLANTLPVANKPIPDYTTSEAGNPFVDGWYADPDTEIYDGLYWVFPTSSYSYDEQTYLDAFSSPDLVHWTKHPNILTTADVSWATRAVWAPAPIFRNGKYYLYFGANDIQEGENIVGGIGVAVSDKPEGPYVDAIGVPLIGEYHNGAQPIDQDVFIDDDGQAYIYYGGHSRANVAKLNDDMVSIGTFDDGTQFKEITPKDYVEGSQMIKRNGKYYFMWSEGSWTGPDYSVSYAMSDSPLGPFTRVAKILQQDSAVAKGSGHHGVIHIPDSDIWYMVYHRRPLSEADGNHRVLAYDRMYFNGDGTIQPVQMLVRDNFADGHMYGWTVYDGRWAVADERLTVAPTAEAKAMLDTDFADLVFEATVSISYGLGDAGLVFRARHLSTSSDGYKGYYAAITRAGRVVLEKVHGEKRTTLGEAGCVVTLETEYAIRVTAIGHHIDVYVDDFVYPMISVKDKSFSHGATGVGARVTASKFGHVSVQRP
ncbi:glycoside hydrolase family 43 protein [Daldinia caldariorum]|uniref:glycoside hydrolase family 43 protein n=1 Tax=Daldinia caldariorum TaxID=326644 RepID=UPI0020087B0C|nr:glycoside hydrolase family 43 protein [Daldinia caldariorum]KAI1470049.1 glycoside hydrolase family 43 protein [Daldinia caldariorum]